MSNFQTENNKITFQWPYLEKNYYAKTFNNRWLPTHTY